MHDRCVHRSALQLGPARPPLHLRGAASSRRSGSVQVTRCLLGHHSKCWHGYRRNMNSSIVCPRRGGGGLQFCRVVKCGSSGSWNNRNFAENAAERASSDPHLEKNLPAPSKEFLTLLLMGCFQTLVLMGGGLKVPPLILFVKTIEKVIRLCTVLKKKLFD